MGVFFRKIILLVFLFNLLACQSSHISLIRIDTIDLQGSITSSDKNITPLIEVKSIVEGVCEQFQLQIDTSWFDMHSATNYSRYWGSANQLHPNSIYLSLSENQANQNILEISLFEWQAIKHTEFGQNFLKKLLSDLEALVPEQELTIENL